MIGALIVVVLLALTVRSAHAEGRIRIAEQFGIVYLLLNVAQEQKLIEKHGKANGVDISVEWLRLSGGANVNDALLSGSIDIAGAGIGPLLTAWDRTVGRQNIKGVAGLGNFPYYLVSSNPAVKSIADLSEKDRIAVPSVTVSVQSRFLQLAAAKLWGDDQYAKLDKYTVALPHPDATAALLAGGTELNGHFSNPPFQYQVLANPAVKVILNSYDVIGGANTPTVLFTTEKFRRENPKTYQAFVAALEEASAFVKANKAAAADIYLKVSGTKADRADLLKIIESPEVDFTIVPTRTFALAAFLHRVGAIRNKPARWQDYFFEDARIAAGS
ncbi:MAG: ABC transporter substrate-binding protein [Lautropia sp.]